jgi:hypothetical protein
LQGMIVLRRHAAIWVFKWADECVGVMIVTWGCWINCRSVFFKVMFQT